MGCGEGELGVRADEVRREIGARADEIATKARDAEWVPMFERDAFPTNGGQGPSDVLGDATASVQEGAADAGTATGEVAERAAEDTADAINDAYDTVDRETRS